MFGLLIIDNISLNKSRGIRVMIWCSVFSLQQFLGFVIIFNIHCCFINADARFYQVSNITIRLLQLITIGIYNVCLEKAALTLSLM
jgi:hypothetical protein